MAEKEIKNGTESKTGKKCFIITPIGDQESLIFRKAKGVIESVIKPILNENGFSDVKPAYEINTSGMINTQIINRIIEDDLVVVNLTGNNPNVMYELCLRHIVAKPIIQICENGTVLPFDIKDNRTIFYKDDMLGVDELRNSFENFLSDIKYEEENLDNPIYNAYKTGKLLKEFNSSDYDNAEKKMLAEMYTKVCEMSNNAAIYTKLYKSENDLAIKRYEMNDVNEYTENDFMRDVKRVNLEDVQRVKLLTEKDNGNGKLKVHELAKELDIRSRAIIYMLNNVGIKKAGAASSLKEDEIRFVTDYIRLKNTDI